MILNGTVLDFVVSEVNFFLLFSCSTPNKSKIIIVLCFSLILHICIWKAPSKFNKNVYRCSIGRSDCRKIRQRTQTYESVYEFHRWRSWRSLYGCSWATIRYDQSKISLQIFFVYFIFLFFIFETISMKNFL